MKDGDVAGLSAFQYKYGYVAVTQADGTRNLVMHRAANNGTIAYTSTPIPLTADTVHLKVDANYENFANKASFFYSLDGQAWTKIGDDLSMDYLLEHFMGYRFGIFNYATQSTGGYVDVDYFHAGDAIGQGVVTPPADCIGTAPIIDNGGFESGAVSPWTGNGSAQIAVTADEKASGGWSAKATGRVNTGDGPMQSVAGELTSGSTYTVSGKVKYTSGPASKPFNITITDGSHYYIMASATATKGEWQTISGEYTLPAGADLNPATAKVFLETPWTPPRTRPTT